MAVRPIPKLGGGFISNMSISSEVDGFCRLDMEILSPSPQFVQALTHSMYDPLDLLKLREDEFMCCYCGSPNPLSNRHCSQCGGPRGFILGGKG